MTESIEHMEKAGRVASGLLSALIRSIRAGVTTRAIADHATTMLAPAGLAPAVDEGGPWLSVNVNEEACHALPSSRILRQGDVLTVDLAMRTAGPDPVCLDLARTVVVGRDPRWPVDQRRALAAATTEVNRAVLAAIRPGGRWSDAAAAGRAAAAERGYVILPGFPGHGIGASLHQQPVAGYHGEADFPITPGLVLTVEPILVAAPGAAAETLGDGWTVVTADGRDAAFAEWTVAIVAGGARVIAA